MDPFLQKVFAGQIWLQCRFALQAYDDLLLGQKQLDELVKDPSWYSVKGDDLISGKITVEEVKARMTETSMAGVVMVWYPIQAFLTSVANISKALWGQSGKLTTQREPLRTSLKVRDPSALEPTAMRNHFDHFDDRLDTWWATSTNHIYIDLNVGAGITIGRGVATEEVFRSYNDTTGELIFWGQPYHLPTIVEEIRDLMPEAFRLTMNP